MQNYSDTHNNTFELKSVANTQKTENEFNTSFEATSPIRNTMRDANNVIPMPFINLSGVKVIKKDGTKEEYNITKVVNAVKKSAARMMITFSDDEIRKICELVNYKVSQNYDNEVRIMAYDVALMGEKKGKDNNDNSVLTNLRLIPESDSYRRQLVDMRAYSGVTTTEQAINIKRYFYENEMDWLILDTMTIGMGVYDELIKVTYDEKTDKEYPAWCAYNDDDLKARASKDAIPVIYAFTGSSERNSLMASHTRDLLQRKRVELLVPNEQAVDYLNEVYGYDDAMIQETAVQHPLVQIHCLRPAAAVADQIILPGHNRGSIIDVGIAAVAAVALVLALRGPIGQTVDTDGGPAAVRAR